jgi:hypothetical protein
MESVEKHWKFRKCWMLESGEAPNPSENLAGLRRSGEEKGNQEDVLRNTGLSVEKHWNLRKCWMLVRGEAASPSDRLASGGKSEGPKKQKTNSMC